MPARAVGVGAAPNARRKRHCDAIDGARGQAQFASRAAIGNDGMHHFRRADYRVGRTCLNAKRASDAGCFIDVGEGQRRRGPAAFVDRKHRRAEQICERRDRGITAGRATVDRRVAGGNRVGIRSAAVVAAAAALRLRQQGIDRIGGNRRKDGKHAVILPSARTTPFVTLEKRFVRGARFPSSTSPFIHMPAIEAEPADTRPRARLAANVLAFLRWRTVVARPTPQKAVIIFYPHTSNWDFVIGLLAKWALGFDVHWVGKESLFRGPLGGIFKRWGGIAVDRSARTGSIARLAEVFSAHDRFLLALAPEGTRQRVEHWRSGFYYLALAAKVPLALAFIDYPSREVGVAGYLELSGDSERDLAAIAAFYAGRTGRRPALQSPIRFETGTRGG